MFDHHSAYPFEMQKTLSTYACAAETLARKTKMLSSIEIRYLRKMQKIALALRLCSQIVLWSCCWWKPGYRRQPKTLKNNRKTRHFQKSDIENTNLVEMLNSLSHYTCAAKSLFSANTNAKSPITVSRKCLENQCKTNDFDYF